jgi:uncharacterized membrane protein AbrB (regulator of aidB expression)
MFIYKNIYIWLCHIGAYAQVILGIALAQICIHISYLHQYSTFAPLLGVTSLASAAAIVTAFISVSRSSTLTLFRSAFAPAPGAETTLAAFEPYEYIHINL